VTEPPRRIGVMGTPGRPELVAGVRRRVEETAAAAGVEIGAPEDDGLDLLVVLGGDGTMLRALRATLGSGTPVLGINFGRVGFLTTVSGDKLDEALALALAGDVRVVDLCTLEARLDGETHAAVNDVVVTSSRPGRMVELGWEVAGEDLGDQPCDGMICCTPSGSTAYNLSNGGPVLMWGLEAIALTYVAAHSLHARPLVVPPGKDVIVWNRSPDVGAGVLVDGHQVATLEKAERAVVRLGEERSLLATLPEATFVRRYRQSFAS
jgi:NAD+ kinase